MAGRISIVALLVWNIGSVSLAQPVVVQQPQVQVFSIDTAVSVPDRGAVLLGGVASAATGSHTLGPFPWGSSWGQEYRSSTAWSHVWIHDLAAMDAAILAEARRRELQRFEQSIRQSAAAAGLGPQLPQPVRDQAARARHQLLKRESR